MKNFKEFLALGNFDNLHELYDLMQSTQNIHIDSWPMGHIYEFNVKIKVDGEIQEKSFTLNAIKASLLHRGHRIENAFKIYFSGDTGVALSGISGMAANLVYKNVLLGIKKIFEIQEKQNQPINALLFSAADPKMMPVYYKFAQKFLFPDPPEGYGFVLTEPNTYLAKRWIRENHDKFSSEDLYQIIKTNREVRQEIKRIKKEKRAAL
jgi:hypothetical protein